MTTQLRSQVRWSIWVKWMLVNIAWLIVFMIIGQLAPSLFSGILSSSIFGVVPMGVIASLLTGLMQWIVIRQHLNVRLRKWIIATLLGAVIGLPTSIGLAIFTVSTLHVSMNDNLTFALIGLTLGIVLGLTQWLTFRTQVSNSRWWIIANAVGWAFGLMLGWRSNPQGHPELLPWFPGLVTVSIVSAITGLALVYLLRNPLHQLNQSTSSV